MTRILAQNPRLASILGIIWGAGRAAYAAGYISGGPSGRLVGTVIATFGGAIPMLAVALRDGVAMAGLM